MISFNNILIVQDIKGKSLSYFAKLDNPILSQENVKEMISLSRQKNNCDLRICLHKNIDEKLHQMVILHNNNVYRRPQKHNRRDETYQIIWGKMALFIFNNKGEIVQSKILDTKKNFISRINHGYWHLTIPLTKYVIFHEIKSGKFNRSLDSIFPDWAPDGNDKLESTKYYQKLLKTL